MNFLLVEDERDICLAMVDRLRDIRSDHQDTIDYRFSALEALDLIRSKYIDCLITDIRLGNQSGLDLIEQARGIQPSLKSIVVTAYDDFEYAQRALRLGCVDFLLKPFTRQAFREALERAMPKDTQDDGEDSIIRLDWVKGYVREHLHEDIDMSMITEKLHMNYAYFSRKFKEKTGQTFSDFLTDMRMKEAQRLLASGRNVSETAERVGYNNIFAFTRAFKRKYGQPPTQWVRKKRNAGGNDYEP